jgi:hypothetical protein
VKKTAQFRIQRLIIDTGRAYLIFPSRFSGPGFSAIVFHWRMDNWNFGRLGGSRRRWHSSGGLLCLLQGGYLGLQALYGFLRGFLELPKLALQVLDGRGLSKSRRNTEYVYQCKTIRSGGDHS